jgi:hypothetical protein
MKAHHAALPLLLAVCCVPGRAQAPEKTNSLAPSAGHNNSGPLTWISSDVNPKTVFWIQGRWVPIDNVEDKGPADVETIICSVREQECLEMDSTSPMAQGVQAWIEEYKASSWDNSGILATGRSLDGCTDETLRIRFAPPSAVIINSPVLPLSANCKKINNAWNKLSGYPAHGTGKEGSALAAQMEQDKLVPTRGFLPFQDWVPPDAGKAPNPAEPKDH